MNYEQILNKKKKNEVLSFEELSFFFNGYINNKIDDDIMTVMLKLICKYGLTDKEIYDLTDIFINSGDTLDLSSFGTVVDKHSTGGVGDKTTILLAPLVASCGIPVAKMSGRGLGHTGGTIDKLESFKGFSVNLPEEKFIDNVNKHKIALVAQTGHLAPADKKIYALRDVTATVDNMSLIASSIMSKKIASGADAIVLDVKVGEGAFMKTPREARALAQEMVDIGNNVGRQTIAIISDMDQPLGYAIGNSLEVIEAINTLKGNGPKDLLELTLTLGSYMLILGKKASSFEEGYNMLLENIKNGKALEKLKEFVKAQGGDEKYIDNTNCFEKASFIIEVKAEKSGIISKIHAEKLGLIAMELGAGRVTKESEIDLSVGIVLNKKRGDKVNKGEILAYIHANDMKKGEKASKKLINAIEIQDSFKDDIPLIYEVIK